MYRQYRVNFGQWQMSLEEIWMLENLRIIF